MPRIRRGAERSRDESLIEFSPKTSSASVACSESDDASIYPDGGHGSLDISPDLTVFGFDQKRLTVNDHGYDACGPASSADLPIVCSSSEHCMNDQHLDSAQPTTAFDPNPERTADNSTGAPVTPMFLENALMDIRVQNCGRRVIRQPQQARRFRPRSISDPGEPQVPLLVLDRRRERRAAEESAPNLTTATEQLIDLDSASYTFNLAVRDDTSLVTESPIAQRYDRGPINGQYNTRPARAPVSPILLNDAIHARFQSLPNSPANDLQPHISLPSRRPELGQRNSTASALLDAMQNRLSPLEELANNASAWTAELPIRINMRPESVVQLSSPDELGRARFSNTIDIGHRATLYEGFTDGRERGGARESEGLFHRLHDTRETIQRTHYGTEDAGIRASRWRRGAGPLVEFAVGRGGRPSHGAEQRVTVSGPHRRLPSAEQENEGEMDVMGQERRWLERRSGEERGGILQSTPPAEGRFERFL